MLTILRNCDLHTPTPLGRRDLLIAGGRIAGIYEQLPVLPLAEVREIDCGGRPVVPGFVDSHVHILGGGGNRGPATRGPELMLSQFTTWGITTAVGLLGADGTTRDLMGLLAKARSLESEGLSTYIFIGAYDVPHPTFTGDLKTDLMLVDKALGAGEIAIADWRSSMPTLQEIVRIAAQTAIAGRLTGRGGVVNIHVGAGKGGIQMLFDAVDQTDLTPETFLPTHCNRTSMILDQMVKWGKGGGPIDLTTHRVIAGSVHCPEAVDFLRKHEVPLDRISMSTDAGGVFPFLKDEQGNPKMAIWENRLLYDEFRALVLGGHLDLEGAVRLASTNPARHLRLYPRKGSISVGADADLVVLTEDLAIEKVFAGGRLMVEYGSAVVKGVFEK